MCGICGKLTWGQTPKISPDLLKKMNESLIHRGPDDEGSFMDSFIDRTIGPGSIGMAMRRLSIIDLNSGKQPIESENGDVVVVYNGETYNFQDLRAELIQKGHKFKTQTDTEVLVHGYEVWGDEMPAKLNGMFGFSLWDKKNNRFLLVRDRMGIKPIYYAYGKNRLVFGSEIKAILEDPEVSREIDPFALDDYLSLRYVPTPRSIYKEIRKLEPATMLIWEKGQIHFRKYWDYAPQNSVSRSLSQCLEEVDFLMEDAVKRQLASDVPLGTFLSGGVDSPTISYYAKKSKPDLMTFNIYFSEKSFSEREEAKAVANFLGTHHIEKEVFPEVEGLIPKLVDIFDEPFGDDSMVPTYFLNKLAREHMTVALSGDGGDELFGGYPTYLADRAALLYRGVPKLMRRFILEPLVQKIPVSFNRISLDYKAKAFVRAAGRNSPLEHFGWTEIFTSEMKRSLYSPSFLEQTATRPLAESYVHAYADGASRKGLERFLYVDQRTHLLDEFLVKVDRLSMAHSLEVRPPFLDHRLVELASEIPMKYKLKGWTTKYILRRLMKGRLPESILKGSKKGFSPPTATWLATDLKDYARRKLSPSHLEAIPYLNPQYPGQILEEHIQRKANWGRRLWTLLMFVEWYDRKVLDRN